MTAIGSNAIEMPTEAEILRRWRRLHRLSLEHVRPPRRHRGRWLFALIVAWTVGFVCGLYFATGWLA